MFDIQPKIAIFRVPSFLSKSLKGSVDFTYRTKQTINF